MIDFIYLSDYITPFVQQEKDMKHEGRWVSSKVNTTGRRLSRWVSTVPPTVPLKDDQLVTHAQMFQLGDKFFIPTLKAAAMSKFKFRFGPGNVDADDLAAAINIVYNTSAGHDNEMKECVSGCLVKASDRAIFTENVRAAIESVENLSVDLFERVKYGSQSEPRSGEKLEQAETAMKFPSLFDPDSPSKGDN
jgi:hypothetical protein